MKRYHTICSADILVTAVLFATQIASLRAAVLSSRLRAILQSNINGVVALDSEVASQRSTTFPLEVQLPLQQTDPTFGFIKQSTLVSTAFVGSSRGRMTQYYEVNLSNTHQIYDFTFARNVSNGNYPPFSH